MEDLKFGSCKIEFKDTWPGEAGYCILGQSFLPKFCKTINLQPSNRLNRVTKQFGEIALQGRTNPLYSVIVADPTLIQSSPDFEKLESSLRFISQVRYTTFVVYPLCDIPESQINKKYFELVFKANRTRTNCYVIADKTIQEMVKLLVAEMNQIPNLKKAAMRPNSQQRIVAEHKSIVSVNKGYQVKEGRVEEAPAALRKFHPPGRIELSIKLDNPANAAKRLASTSLCRPKSNQRQPEERKINPRGKAESINDPVEEKMPIEQTSDRIKKEGEIDRLTSLGRRIIPKSGRKEGESESLSIKAKYAESSKNEEKPAHTDERSIQFSANYVTFEPVSDRQSAVNPSIEVPNSVSAKPEELKRDFDGLRHGPSAAESAPKSPKFGEIDDQPPIQAAEEPSLLAELEIGGNARKLPSHREKHRTPPPIQVDSLSSIADQSSQPVPLPMPSLEDYTKLSPKHSPKPSPKPSPKHTPKSSKALNISDPHPRRGAAILPSDPSRELRVLGPEDPSLQIPETVISGLSSSSPGQPNEQPLGREVFHIPQEIAPRVGASEELKVDFASIEPALAYRPPTELRNPGQRQPAAAVNIRPVLEESKSIPVSSPAQLTSSNEISELKQSIAQIEVWKSTIHSAEERATMDQLIEEYKKRLVSLTAPPARPAEEIRPAFIAPSQGLLSPRSGPPQLNPGLIPPPFSRPIPAHPTVPQSVLDNFPPRANPEPAKTDPEFQTTSSSFITIPKEDIQCLVCMDIPEVSRTTACCGAVICEQCVARVERSKCPQCRKPLSMVENMFLKRLLNNVDVACACGAMVKRKDKEAHRSVCERKVYVCDCGQFRGTKEDLKRHLKEKHARQILKFFVRRHEF